MNKIIVNKNIISNKLDDSILIEGNNIKFIKSGSYEIEYIDCTQVSINYIVSGCKICLYESSFDNDISINNRYYVDGGSVIVNKFYNNKNVFEDIEIDLCSDGDTIDYKFSNICMGIERYNISINHRNKNTNSNISNKSITLKNSKLDYIINSRVDKGCLNSKLDQNTRIVTMGDSRCHVEPNMYIDLDDAIAKHGSVIGTFNKDQIFYLMSKGISYNDCLKLLIKGYLLSNIDVSVDLRWRIIDIIDMYWR